MMKPNRTFLTGAASGAALAIATAALMGHARQDETPPPAFFVTGDTSNATVWLLQPDGTLECISRNVCIDAALHRPENLRPRPMRGPDWRRFPDRPDEPGERPPLRDPREWRRFPDRR